MTKKLFGFEPSNQKYAILPGVVKARRTGLLANTLAFFGLSLSLLLPGLVSAQAASGAISLSSSAATVTQGNQFTVTINASAGEPISGVQAYVTYDASKLSFVSADYNSSAWSNELSQDTGGGSGYYQVARFTFTQPYPSTGRLARLTFQATSTGAATIGVSAANSLVYSGNTGQNILGSVSGTTITVNAPAPAAAAPTPGTSKPASGGSPAAYTPPTTASTAEAAAAASPAETIDPTKSTAGETVLLSGKERETSAEQLANTLKTSSKLPVPLLGALGLFVLIGVGLVIVRRVSSGGGFAHSVKGFIPPGSTPEAPTLGEPPVVLSPPNPPASGTVFTPSSSTKEPTDKVQ